MTWGRDGIKNKAGDKKIPCLTITDFSRSLGFSDTYCFNLLRATDDIKKPKLQFTVKQKKFYAVSDLNKWYSDYLKDKAVMK
jgi:hypothetical protein